MSIKKKAKHAVIWSGIDAILRQGLSFGFGVALAHLITPEEFGTVAMLYFFTGLAQVFADAGFGAALIQSQTNTYEDESTVFWFNVFSGGMVSVVLCLVSPWIAHFYETPVLRPLTCLMALNVFVSTFGSIQTTLLTKDLDFRAQLYVSLVTVLASGVIGVVLALKGWGVWAVGWQAVAGSVSTVVVLWLVRPWRPLFVFKWSSLKRLFRFGGYLFAAAMLDTSFQRLYTLLIGKFYNSAALGFFNRADQVQQLPQTILTRILSRVMFPVYSSLQNSQDQLRKGVELSIKGILYITVPVAFGTIVTARELISVVYGDRWLPAVPILQVLAFLGLLYPLQILNLNVLKAQGHSHLFFRLEVIKKAIGTALLFGGCFFGVIGVAYARLIGSVFQLVVNTWYTGVFLDFGTGKQIRIALPIFLAGAVMALLVQLTRLLPEQPDLIVLLSKVAIGVSFWALVLLIIGYPNVVGVFKLKKNTDSKTVVS